MHKEQGHLAAARFRVHVGTGCPAWGSSGIERTISASRCRSLCMKGSMEASANSRIAPFPGVSLTKVKFGRCRGAAESVVFSVRTPQATREVSLVSTWTSITLLAATTWENDATGASSLIPVMSKTSTSAPAALWTTSRKCSSGSRGRSWICFS